MTKSKVLSLAVALILFMNVVLLLKIGDLNEQIKTLSQSSNQLQSNIHSISTDVNQSLERFTREQSWITPVQINHEQTKAGLEQGQAVLNWQIKDFREGSKVIFHYRWSESEEFQAIAAENKATGFFQVQIPLKIKAEPYWDVRVALTGEKGTAQQAAEVIKQAEQSILCYVSLETKDSVKSSEVSYLDLGYLANSKYEPVRGHVDINRSHYNISLFEDHSGNNSFESVTVEFYNGSNLVAEKPLEVQEERSGIKNYYLSYNAGSESISRILLKVKYRNGDSFQKEIY